MTIDVGPDWRIASDRNCYWLERRRVSEKTGRERWETRGYYSSLRTAYETLLRRDVREDEAEGVAAVLARVEQVERWIAVSLREAQS